MAPNSVYRILDLFVANNPSAASRANAFVANSHPGCLHDCIFLIGDECAPRSMSTTTNCRPVRAVANATGFAAERPVISGATKLLAVSCRARRTSERWSGASAMDRGTARKPARPNARFWTAFGIAVLLFGAYLAQVFPQSGHDIAPGYGPPVLAFEFAGSQADLEAIFGFFTDPPQVTRLAAMRAGNEQDYLYMLLYAGFLTSGCLALWRELRLRPLLAAALLPIAAALCDGWENWLLFDIQAAFTLGDYSPAMATLHYPVSAKFLLLAATNVVIGAPRRSSPLWALTAPSRSSPRSRP